RGGSAGHSWPRALVRAAGGALARNPWTRLPKQTRSVIGNLVKLLITVAGFTLLLTHHVSTWMSSEPGVFFAPIEGEVVAMTVDGAPLPQVGDLDALRTAASGFTVDAEHDLLYVKLEGNAHPRGRSIAADGQPELGSIPIARAIRGYVSKVDGRQFVLWSLVAMGVKFVGVMSSAFAWFLLL